MVLVSCDQKNKSPAIKKWESAEALIMNNDGLNNENTKLTIEELKKCKGFDGLSESEANEIIESLFQLAIIGYNIKE